MARKNDVDYEKLVYSGGDIEIRGLTADEIVEVCRPLIEVLASTFGNAEGRQVSSLLQNPGFALELMLDLMSTLPELIAKLVVYANDQPDNVDALRRMITVVAIERITALSAAHIDRDEHGSAATRHSRASSVRH